MIVIYIFTFYLFRSCLNCLEIHAYCTLYHCPGCWLVSVSPEEVDGFALPNVLILGVHVPARGALLGPRHEGAQQPGPGQSEGSSGSRDCSPPTTAHLRRRSSGPQLEKASPLSWRWCSSLTLSSSAVPVSSTVIVMMPKLLARVDRCMSFLVILHSSQCCHHMTLLRVSVSPDPGVVPEDDLALLLVEVQHLILLLVAVRVSLLVLGSVKPDK